MQTEKPAEEKARKLLGQNKTVFYPILNPSDHSDLAVAVRHLVTALSRIDTLEARLKEVGEELPKIKPSHYDCEGDTWFGCPKSENGCADESEGDKCNCGAEKAIEIYDRIHSIATRKD